MDDTFIKLTDLEGDESLFIDVRRIISIEPNYNGLGRCNGSRIQYLMPRRTWLFRCHEHPDAVNNFRKEVTEKLDYPLEPVDRFDLIDLEDK